MTASDFCRSLVYLFNVVVVYLTNFCRRRPHTINRNDVDGGRWGAGLHRGEQTWVGGLVVMFSQAPGCRVKSSLSTIYWWYFNFSAIVSVRFFPVVFVCFNFILYVYFLCNFFAFCNFNRILSTMKNTRPSSYYYYTAQNVSRCIWILLICTIYICIYIVDVHTYVPYNLNISEPNTIFHSKLTLFINIISNRSRSGVSGFFKIVYHFIYLTKYK